MNPNSQIVPAGAPGRVATALAIDGGALVAMVVSVAAAVAMHALWPLGVGVLCAAILHGRGVVLSRSRDVAQRSLEAAASTTLRLAPAMDPMVRQAADSIASSRREREHVLSTTPNEVKHRLDVAIQSAADLEERGLHLVDRANALVSFLAAADSAPVRAERSRLSELMRRSSDEEARRQYEQARQARDGHLRMLDELSVAHERILANLARIAAALEALPARMIHIRALDAQALDRLSADLSEELDGMSNELQRFEESLRAVAHTG